MASGCRLLTALDLRCCRSITNAAMMAVASECKLLTTLDLYQCTKITDAAVDGGGLGMQWELKSLHLGSRGSASEVHWSHGVHYPLLGGREKICCLITGGRAGALGGAFSSGSFALGITSRGRVMCEPTD